MRLLALAILVLAAVVAAAAGFSIYTWGYRSSTSSYDGYGPVVREWFALSRVEVKKIKHLAGPFYAVRYRSQSNPRKQYCVMVDVSTEYKGAANELDRLWWTDGPSGSGGKHSICDF